MFSRDVIPSPVPPGCDTIFEAMTLEKNSPCKVNLLLNILARRVDGFHELETLMHPVPVYDRLSFAREGQGIVLTCNNQELPTDNRNLVHRAAAALLARAGIDDGVRIHLEKRIPLAAGLGGGSGNAAVTLVGVNELFGHPLPHPELEALAAKLGSDVPFFLQDGPALATGRGEKIEPLSPLPALAGTAIVLVHPGFGIATAWAYQQLSRFPQSLNGRPGRARELADALGTPGLEEAGRKFYNSLEGPALEKYPVLRLYQDFFRNNGAAAALMSGSGSTTFAIFPTRKAADQAVEPFMAQFGDAGWITVVNL